MLHSVHMFPYPSHDIPMRVSHRYRNTLNEYNSLELMPQGDFLSLYQRYGGTI